MMIYVKFHLLLWNDHNGYLPPSVKRVEASKESGPAWGTHLRSALKTWMHIYLCIYAKIPTNTICIHANICINADMQMNIRLMS